MIPAKKDWFIKDTWIPIDEFYPLTYASVLKACLEKKCCNKVHELRPETIGAIRNCIKNSQDISGEFHELLFKK